MTVLTDNFFLKVLQKWGLGLNGWVGCGVVFL